MINISTALKNVINLDYLFDLSKGNTQFVKEMIDTFLVENPKEIESLEKAIQDKNFESVKHAAHLLQSSLPFVGVDKIIANEVYEIEKIAANKSMLKKNEMLPADRSGLQKIEQLFSNVKETCARACQELKEMNLSQFFQK